MVARNGLSAVSRSVLYQDISFRPLEVTWFLFTLWITCELSPVGDPLLIRGGLVYLCM
jgi:hypothetical protein